MASVAKRRWTKPDGATGEAWIVRYLDPAGRHRQRTFDRKKEADTYRSKVEADQRTGMVAPQADRITIAAAAEGYLAYLDEQVKHGRVGRIYWRHRESFIRIHVLPLIGNVKLAQVNLDVLTTWRQGFHAARRIAPFTGRNIVQTLKAIFDFAMRREWIHRNPVLLLLGEMRGIEPARVRTFTMEEMRALLIAAGQAMYRGRRDDSHLRTQCAVHLAAFCGLRIGEIFGMRVENVDFDKGTIRVHTSLSRDGIKKPKTAAGFREIAMPAHIAVLLRAWIERHLQPNAAGVMFAYRDGRPMSCCAFRSASWAPLLKRAGLAERSDAPTFHFHALRHFFASLTIDSEWSLPEVAKTIGHSKVDMTLSVYAHALSNRGADAVQMQALSDRMLLSAAGADAHVLRMGA